MWEQDEELWNSGKQYAYALSLDPLTHHNLGPGDPFENFIQLGRAMRLLATKNEHNKDPVKFIAEFRRTMNVMVNQVYILDTGDILYFPGGGIIP